MPNPQALARILGRDYEPTPPAGHETLGPYLLRVIWTLAALSSLFLGLRAYCKLSRGHRLWWDDYFLIASWVAVIYSISLQTVAVHYGLGMHYEDLSDAEISELGLFSMAAGFGTILATCWTKTSFAITLLRISDGHMRHFIWFIIISVNLVLGSNGIIHWIQCWPVQKTWHSEMDGSCFSPDVVRGYNTATAVFSGVMDILLALLPWRIIWTATINKRERLGALVAMSTGVLVGIIAFLKIKTMYVIGNASATTVDLQIFGTAEPATAIMAASIPMLRVLIQRSPASKPSRFIELVRSRTDTAPSALDTKRNAEDSWEETVTRSPDPAHARLRSPDEDDDERYRWAS
ncbi:uncharacterized protein C8A04DRAFT_10874 [Dichotomopilus funicola]|uniref:Rhodopsin domain-containing protein n=1 Tax=Dichotomopilus funicola TaxID=1934379 RepID=A0AAN6V5X9_9PEZI|nr:hypothetical protein C8A04DRAFT_10874 [Dichotomopilus funicola]